ncbi:hypothetical protein [Flexivirga meconopsidis]|uniref:hypothetical protein n=1 Tax=Flexivirga meconopsidis TaxID=2977121 RepID=UPI00223EFC3A|nr:hypothetical protein [Flexivirga meconopsidis]
MQTDWQNLRVTVETTGIVTAPKTFLSAEDRAAGKTAAQLMSDDGQLVWDIEAMRRVKGFSGPETRIFKIRVVGKQPVLSPGPLALDGVTITTRTTRQPGQLAEMVEAASYSQPGTRKEG